jgi:hypothetical protein
MKKFIIFVFCLLAFPLLLDVYGHQPRLVIDKISSLTNPIPVEEPEVSKAYYGEIEKSSEYYKIGSNKEFDLYLSLQVPDIPMQSKNITLELIDKSGLQLARLDGSQHTWSNFHEDFGNADYLQGPSLEMLLPAGIYAIMISGDENTKYVLVTGYKEEFPASEFLNSLLLVPKINLDFFGMNIFQSLSNVFGFLLLVIFSIIGLVVLLGAKRIIRSLLKIKS